MDILFVALILGLVEGITEFLPVSSTGHLILVADLLNFKGETAQAFEVVIQLGAILGVVFLYRERFLALIPGYLESNSALSGILGCKKIIVACLPALVLGALFHKQIKSILFGSYPVALALVVGGFIMLWVERKARGEARGIDALGFRDALIIGCAQALALWPGISRSGATIVAALLLGFTRVAAAEFSFLLAVPLLFVAAAHDLYKHPELLEGGHLAALIVGFIVAWVSATLAVKAFVAFLGRATLKPFAWYRIMLGCLIFLLV